MATVRMPTETFASAFADSRRWEGFEYRPDDIVITTPPKSGTTWMQGIVSSLLWPAGDAPGTLEDRSPWIESHVMSAEEVHASLDRMQHRRFIKSHTPADAMPIVEQCRYITVYRDARDTLVSWAHHRRSMRRGFVEFLNAAAAEQAIDPAPTIWDGDMDVLMAEWSEIASPVQHLASWWPLRHEPFVLLVHYADLQRDLAGEMGRVADFLDIDVPDGLWDEVVARCHIDRMRTESRGHGNLDLAFRGGADAFYNQGGTGRGRKELSSSHLARIERLVTEGLAPSAAAWLAAGSLVTGTRPADL